MMNATSPPTSFHESDDESSTRNAYPYPYTRAEECSWQPEEVARHLAALALSSSNSDSTQLLSHGWSSRQIGTIRQRYGSNHMQGDPAEQERDRTFRRLLASKLVPIFSAFLSQLKEPLILMLLGSAAISLILGNTADAMSIAIALVIVGLVAAVQEYRSEAALEKLSSLVPHTCTVLRDGKVIDDFWACDLVVGDLVLLSTGE